MSDLIDFQNLRIEALEKELQRYKEICEQFQNRYDTLKATPIKVIDPIFLKPIEK